MKDKFNVKHKDNYLLRMDKFDMSSSFSNLEGFLSRTSAFGNVTA